MLPRKAASSFTCSRLFAFLFLLAAPAFAEKQNSPSIEALPAFQGAGVEFSLEQIPSALWPTFIELQDASGLTVKEGARGTLIRVVGDELVVDFGRMGMATIDFRQTNFLEEITKRLSGAEEKDFPNLALQIGNKLLRFDRGKESGAIRFEHVENKILYILLYVDQYQPDLAQDLLDFGVAYTDLEELFPELILILMPNDRTFYDFGATTSYSVPMITPFVRKGYIASLAHGISQYPAFVACDANGKVLGRSHDGLQWNRLAKELEALLKPIGIQWTAPYIQHRNSNTRAAWWKPVRR